MEVIVHYPTDSAKINALKIKVSEIYGEAVKSYINNLEFTKEYKIKLIGQLIKSQKLP